ncbi:MAG: DUF4893 domain-containing protein [Sphingomonas sp.]|uniref:DUF4893 domain-containing protein n=1 Tax=Sphingomonas sp. TaxID=28214 RepID=UPI0017B83A65|nr:DUF4893 domain-containing protein [Sphingomonas sp.]MBA3667436.1 DUF4893 domain-containing protein [Sphingomonas sp.]
MRSFPLVAIALGLAACAALPTQRPSPFAASTDWRTVATNADRGRLRDWRTAFNHALDQARKAGRAAEIDREGALLVPDAAIGPVPIPNGRYRCRVIKLGAKSPGMLDYMAYPAFDCRVQQEKQLQSLAKLSGSQRHIGLLFAADPLRQVFLGSLVLGDENRAMQYGRDPDRDLAGWVERIGPARWRLILPYPAFESTLDVIELIPA